MNRQPILRTAQKFRIVGVERFTSNGMQAIRDAWHEFGRRAGEIARRSAPEVRYGFEDYSRPDCAMGTPGVFPKYYYLAGVQVDEFQNVPPGMTAREVPELRCAVFTHSGPMSGVPALFRYVYDVWLPASEYVLDPRVLADFERYPEPVVDPENMTSEIWIPVASRQS